MQEMLDLVRNDMLVIKDNHPGSMVKICRQLEKIRAKWLGLMLYMENKTKNTSAMREAEGRY